MWVWLADYRQWSATPPVRPLVLSLYFLILIINIADISFFVDKFTTKRRYNSKHYLISTVQTLFLIRNLHVSTLLQLYTRYYILAKLISNLAPIAFGLKGKIILKIVFQNFLGLCFFASQRANCDGTKQIYYTNCENLF